MKYMRTAVIIAAAVAASTLATGDAHAGALAETGGYFSGTFPTGDWGEVAGFGLGLENSTTIFPDRNKPFGIRSGGSIVYSFGRNVDVPAANLDANTTLHTETANTSAWLGIGPALARQTGDVRPFCYGTVGINIGWIDSHLKGDVQGAGYDATVGQTSTTFAWTAGAGISKAVSSVPGGRVELSVEYRSFVDQNYLLPSEVTSSGPSVSWDRSHHNADQVLVRIGIVTGD